MTPPISVESRWALRCWLIAIAVFVGAILVGTVIAANGPGGDTVQSWAGVVLPVYASVIYTPVLVVGILLAVRSIRAEGRTARAVLALILCAISVIPAAWLLSSVLQQLSLR